MVPYMFDAPKTDVVLRSSDGKEFHVHRLILSIGSPVFKIMFSLPQSEPVPIVDVSESSNILQPFLQYLYPQSPPKIEDLPMWEAIYTTADKYDADVVMESLRTLLRNQFLETFPFRVYALASHWGFKELAETASTTTLKMDIYRDFPREDVGLMGGTACQRLYQLHYNRRVAARNVIVNHPLPTSSCYCKPPNLSPLVKVLCEIVSKRPWLTAEELYEKAGGYNYPEACGSKCCNTFARMLKHFASILKGISELPRTI